MERVIQTADGRTLAVTESGDLDGRPVLVQVGTPDSRHIYGRAVAAAARGLRLISYDRPGCGDSTARPGRTIADCAADVQTVPPGGESQWSHAMIAGHLAGRGLAISPATVGRVLAGAKVRPHKVRGWLNRADDPGFWARAGAVCRLYLNPPPGTVLISVDEKTGAASSSMSATAPSPLSPR
jgi:pimeloyl-ACP methyl ester carboxylesterase